jgi:hypothetical protein
MSDAPSVYHSYIYFFPNSALKAAQKYPACLPLLYHYDSPLDNEDEVTSYYL